MSGRDEDVRLAKIAATNQSVRLAALNDALRCRGVGGTIMATAGVIALGDAALPQITRDLAAFTAFDADNDPYAEHDFGTIRYAGTKLFWKIDYYDRDLRFGSPDPADPEVTTRVLTVMLAEEW